MDINNLEEYSLCFTCGKLSHGRIGRLNYCPYCGRKRSDLYKNTTSFFAGISVFMPYLYKALLILIFLWVIL